MKKSLVIVVSLALLMLLGFSRNVLAFIPPEIIAKYSGNVPTIDGYMGSAEWNDTRKYVINLINLTGANIEAWLYIKHNGTHMHVGLLVWMISTHATDEFIIAFDEGDDGGSGSGTRDFALTPLQEDLKACYDSTLIDGYYNGSFYAKTDEIDFDAGCVHETDHSTTELEIEHWEGLSWVDDHWESEFAIPFVGNDGGSSDVSDLSCTVADTIGFKIQYWYGPGLNNYYYPEGDKLEINKYANLSFPAPTIESCNAAGDKKDNFNLYEDVYLNGSDFLPSTAYDLHIVNDTEVWTDEMPIPSRISGTATSILSDSNGSLSPTVVWSDPPTLGEYDIIVDVNGNGLYDAGIDALDNNDVEVTAGFIIPEYTSFLILSLFMILTMLGAVLHRETNACIEGQKKVIDIVRNDIVAKDL